MVKQAERVLSVEQVTEVLQVHLKKTYQCTIDFYNNGLMMFTFFDHNDDFLTLRVSGNHFSIANAPRVSDKYLYPISNTFRRAAECMSVLGVKPLSAVVGDEG